MPRAVVARAFRPSRPSFLKCSRSGSYRPRLGPTQWSKPAGWKRTPSLVFCSRHNPSAALLCWTGRKHRTSDVNAIYVLRRDSKEVIMSDMDPTADRPWTLEAVQQLAELAREGVPVPVISLKLKRSIASIHTKLTEL